MPKITKIIMPYYNSNQMTKEQALHLSSELGDKIISFLEKEGFNLSTNGSTDQIKLVNFFDGKGYIFLISPIEISKDMFLISVPLYKKLKVSEYNLSKLKFKDFPELEGVTKIIDVNIVVPDIREYKGISIFDGMTIGNTINGESIFIIIPDNLKKLSKKLGLNEEDYRETVIVNEVSKIIFSKIFPESISLVTLSQIGIETNGHEWKFFHLQEVFSDLASLKYGKTFKSELIRIIKTKGLPQLRVKFS